METMSPWELMERGGPVMWALLGAWILAVALIVERSVVFLWSFQTLRGTIRALRPLILDGAFARAEQWCDRRGPLAFLALIYLQNRKQSKDIRDDILKREGSLELGHFENRLRWLAVLAQISTLLGLLGTFHVMVDKFYQAQASGHAMNPEDFSAAIWEAFLTTMFGLVIAIPCSASYQLFEGRLDKISRDMGAIVSYLDEWSRAAEQSRELEQRGAGAGDGENPLPAPSVPMTRRK
jgi:biopolymer transport protein ExbB